MKKICKVISILVISMVILSLTSINIYAVDPISIDSVKDGADDFINRGQSGNLPVNSNDMANQLAPIAGILTLIGEGLLFIITIIQGIKYITATPDEQAKIKKQLIGLVVAAIVIFGAYEIWKLSYTTLNQVLGPQ